jgi:hypothetical protein
MFGKHLQMERRMDDAQVVSALRLSTIRTEQ